MVVDPQHMDLESACMGSDHQRFENPGTLVSEEYRKKRHTNASYNDDVYSIAVTKMAFSMNHSTFKPQWKKQMNELFITSTSLRVQA